MKKMLVADDLKPLMLNAMDFLRRNEIAVYSAATQDDMLKLHFQENVNLLVTKLDLPGITCETLVHTIRRAEHVRNVSIMLLANSSPAHRERSVRCGVNCIQHMPVDPAIFAGKIQEFLVVAPRRHYRVVLNIAVDGRHNDRPFLCNMENISASGMLIRTSEKLDIGERIACSFFLPTGRKIGASGEIVRQADQQADGAFNRYGIRFISLAVDAASAINTFVERDQQRAIGLNAGAPAYAAAT